MQKLLLPVLIISLSLGMLGCFNDDDGIRQDPADQMAKEIAIIDDSLNAWGITAQHHASGIRYVLQQGTGLKPTVQNAITVNYEGRILGATENFDAGQDVTFPLGNLITGWQIMLPEVQEGGSITMYLPSVYGYGSNGSGPIPGNSILIFDVDLIKVE